MKIDLPDYLSEKQKELLDAIEEIALETNMTIEEVIKQAIELLKNISEEDYLD